MTPISPVGGTPLTPPLEASANQRQALLRGIDQFRESLSKSESSPEEIAAAIINLAKCAKAAQRGG